MAGTLVGFQSQFFRFDWHHAEEGRKVFQIQTEFRDRLQLETNDCRRELKLNPGFYREMLRKQIEPYIYRNACMMSKQVLDLSFSHSFMIFFYKSINGFGKW